MSIEELLDVIEEVEREVMRKWEALPEDVRNHPWIAKPTLSHPHANAGQRDWSMRRVVTGSRRKWKR